MLLKLAQLWTPRVSSHEPKIVCHKQSLTLMRPPLEVTMNWPVPNQHWHGCRVILWVVAQGKTTVKKTRNNKDIPTNPAQRDHINKWATSEKQKQIKNTKTIPEQKNKKMNYLKYGVKSPALNKCVMPNEVVCKYVYMLALPVIIKKHWTPLAQQQIFWLTQYWNDLASRFLRVSTEDSNVQHSLEIAGPTKPSIWVPHL